MKPTPENAARLLFIGLVVLGVVALVAWYRYDAGRYATYRVLTQDAVSGLIADAPVELHGVDVGKVERVTLVDARTVEVQLRLHKAAPITMGTVATVTSRGLATRGFTGYVYVALEDNGDDKRPVVTSANDSVPAIRSAPSRSVNLDTTINHVREDVQRMSELLRDVLDEHTIVSLKQATENMQNVTQTLAQNSSKLNAIIANAERVSGAMDARTVRSLQQSVANLQAITGTLASNNDRLATIMVNAENASGQLSPLLQSGHDAVDSLYKELIPETYTTLAGLQSLSNSLSNTVSRINRDPSVLVRGRASPVPGPGEAQ
ncbi:MAG TPA: MlaD family protein [Burkholderiaceae bacterium]|nr:MlaD family protein [Burkholderiaceae bacterium]